jgi:quercetin dioxygenase-like cupin family protein
MRIHSNAGRLMFGGIAAAIAAAFIACSQEDKTPTGTVHHAGRPSLTVSSGQTTVALGRSAIDPFHVHSDFDKSRVEIKVTDPSDIIVNSSTVVAGGTTGWHKHPGPILVTVTGGVFTYYHGDDPTCTPHVYPAGTAFVELPDDVHIGRNEGNDPLTWVATGILPRGAAPRIDMPAPGNCPF